MSEIITEVQYWKAMEREIRTGFERERETELARERAAANDAKQGAKNVVGKDMQMRKLASIPTADFLRISQKYGVEAWSDDEFLADFRKRKRHLTTDFCPDRKRMRSVSR